MAFGRSTRLLGALAATAFAAGALSACAPEAETEITQPIPVTTVARVGATGWEFADTTVLATVLPEVGDPATGQVALRVDAPVLDGETVAAHTTVEVEPGRTYTASVSYRRLTGVAEPVGAVLRVGDVDVPLEDAAAGWNTATATYAVPAGTEQTDVAIVMTAPVTGVSFDDISLRAEDGTELLENGSFEQTDAPWGIVNDSLVMTAPTAALAVSFPEGGVTWQAQPTAGGDPIAGETEVRAGLDVLPLAELPQGHYEIQVTDAEARAVSTAVVLVDTDALSIEQDARLGVGLHVEREWYQDAGGYAAALGFSEARNDILWSRNETERGVYEWQDYYAREFSVLHANGIKLLGIVNYNNKLYGPGKAPESAQELAAYGRYAAAVADRFDLVGLEVFNEYNQERFNDTKCGTDGGCYVPMLKAVHDAVAEDHPDLPIVAGATARFDREFFIELWQAGGMVYADAMSFHPYEVHKGSPDDVRTYIQQARADMAEYAGDEVPAWITELGWTTSVGGGFGFELQAEFLVRSEILAFAEGVEKYFWYDLVNDSGHPGEHEQNFGLYEFSRRPDTIALAPKPSAFSQAFLIERLRGLAHTASKGDEASVVEVFGTGDAAVRVAWAPEGAGELSVQSDVPLLAADVFGREQVVEPAHGTVTVPLTATPIFVTRAPADAD